jgi:hypothetical protein
MVCRQLASQGPKKLPPPTAPHFWNALHHLTSARWGVINSHLRVHFNGRNGKTSPEGERVLLKEILMVTVPQKKGLVPPTAPGPTREAHVGS